jgi:DNA-binding MarR family transcriptional regulator
MSSKKDHDSKENLGRCFNIVQQSSAKGGISAIEIAKKLGMHRTTVHRHLYSLELMGKVESQQGTWIARKGEQTIKPLEKEIIIELPIPKNEWQRMVLLEHYAELFGKHTDDSDNVFKISLEKLKETRTIKIKGKNVDDLDLEKVVDLIKQANEKSFTVNLKGLLKGFKKRSSSSNKTPTK